MGVPGLWKYFERSARQCTLDELAAEHLTLDASSPSFSGIRAFRIALDASMLMIMATRVIQQRHDQEGISLNEAQTREALELFFRFLLSLACVPGLLVVLVFDGPRRPAIKRDKRVARFPFKLEPRLRVVARALGIASHEAPGEAEFEMAKMALDGVVDACWTGDSDIL